MSKQVDERVVEMQFNNRQFEEGIAKSLKSLERMEKALDKMGASSAGIDAIANNLNKIDFTNLTNNVEHIANRFTFLGNLADQFRTRISNAILDTGKTALTTVTNLTKNGGINRALNIEAAKFQLEGLGVAWNEIEDDINYGVKDTAYGLDAAAKVASQLVASQVEIGDNMKTALRGISGVAAMTNSTYEDIGHIYTTIAGNGRLMGMQLTQLSSHGLNAAAAIGKYMGMTEAEVREAVSKGKISFQTFAEAMDDAFGAHAKEANKTFTGAMSNVKAALSRIGAAFASSAIVDLRDIFNELIPLINNIKKLLMPTIDAINAGVHKVALRIENLIEYIGDIEHNDTLQNIIDGFVNLGKAALSIIIPVLRAFNVFVDTNIYKSVNNLSKSFATLSSKMILPVDKGKKLTNTLRMVLKIVKDIAVAIKAVITVISPLFKLLTSFVDGIFTFFDTINRHFELDITKNIDKSGAVNKIESARNAVENFVNVVLRITKSIPTALAKIVIFIADKVIAIKDWITSIKETEFSQFIGDTVNSIIGYLKVFHKFLVDIGIPVLIGAIGTAITKVVGALKKIPWNTIRDNIKSIFGWLKDNLNAIINLVTGGKFNSVSEVLMSLGERINTFFKGVDNSSESIDKVTRTVNGVNESVERFGGNMVQVETSTKGFINKFIELTDVANKYDRAMFIVGKITKNAGDSINKGAAKGLSASLKTISDNAQGVLTSLYEKVGKPTPGSIMGLAMGAGGVAVLVGLSRVLNSLADFGKNLSSGFGLKTFLTAVGEGISNMQKNMGRAALIKALAISLGIITASIVALAITASKYDIITPAKIIGQFAVIMTGSLAALMIVAKICKTEWKSLAAMSAFAVALGATFILMSKAIINLLNIKWSELSKGQIIGGIIAFGAIVAVLFLSLKYIAGGYDRNGAGAAAIMNLVSVVLCVGILIRAIRKCTSEDIKKLQEGWGAVFMLIIGVTASLVAISFAGKGVALLGAGILGISVAVLITIGVIALISKVAKNSEFETGLVGFIAILVLLSGVLITITHLARGGENAANIGKYFLGVGASIALIALAFVMITKTIEKSDPVSIGTAFGIVAALVAEFMLLGKHIANAGKNASQFAKTFLAIGGAIIMISVAIAILSVLDPVAAWSAMGIVTVFMLLVGFIIKQIKGAQAGLNSLNTGKIVAMTSMFAVLVGSLVTISTMLAILVDKFGGWKTIAIVSGAVGAIFALLVSMALSAKIADKVTQSINWKGMLTLVGTFGIIAASIVALSRFGGSIDRIAMSAGAVITTLIALAIAAKAVNKVVDKKALVSLLALSGIFAAISAAMLILNQVDWQTSAVNAIVAVGVMATLVAMAAIIQEIEASKGVLSILALSAALVGVALALRLLADVPVDNIIAGMKALAVVLGVLVVAAFALSNISGPVAIATLCLLGLAAVPLVLATGLLVASKAIDAFADTLVHLGMRAPAIVAAITTIAEGVKYVVFNAIADILSKIPIVGEELAEGAREAADKAKVAMKQASEEAKSEEAGYQMALKASQGVSKANPEMEQAGGGLLDSLKEGLLGGGGKSDLSFVGSDLITGDKGLLGGITSGFGDLNNAGETGMADFVGLLNQSEGAKESGGYTMQGFFDGTPADLFYDHGKEDAQAYNNGFTGYLNINSPSKVMTNNGEYVMEGLRIGLNNGLPGVITLAQSIAGSTKNALSTVSEQDAKTAGKNVAVGFNNGLADRSINTHIIGTAKKMAENVLKILRNVFKIHSPSKVTEQYGEYVGEGFEKGINTSFDKAQRTFTKRLQWFTAIANSTVKSVASSMKVGGETLLAMSEHFGEWIENVVSPTSALSAARTAITRFIDSNYRQTDAYQEHIETIKAYEKEIDRLSSDMTGNAQEISDLFSNIKSEAESMAKEAASSFKSLRNDIKSTLTDSVKLLNQNLDSGLNLLANFEQQAKTVINSSIAALSTYSSKKTTTLYDSLDIFSGFSKNKKKKNQVKVLFDYINKQVDDVESRIKKIQTLGTMGISNDVRKAIVNMGADADDLIDAMTQMTSEEIQEINNLYAKQISMKKGDEQMIIEDIFSTIHSEIDEVKRKNADYAAIAQKGLSQEFIKELREMGEEGEEMIRGFLAMSEEQIAEFNALYKESQVENEKTIETSVQAAIRTMQENISKLDRANQNYEEALARGLNEKFLKSLKDMGDDGEKIIESFASASAEDIAEANSLWATQQTYTNKALNKSLNSSIDSMNEWAEGLTELAKKGVSEGLLNEIAQAGPSAQNYLTTLLAMTDEELKKFNELYANAQTRAVGATDQAIAAMAINGANAGGAFANAIATYDITASGDQIANNYISFLEGMGVQMNQTAWTVGRNSVLELVRGILEHEEAVVEATDGIVNDYDDSLSKMSGVSSKGVGDAMSAGLDAFESGNDNLKDSVYRREIDWNKSIPEVAEQLARTIVDSEGNINEAILEVADTAGNLTTDQIYELRDIAQQEGGIAAYWAALRMYDEAQKGIKEGSEEAMLAADSATAGITSELTPDINQKTKVANEYSSTMGALTDAIKTVGESAKETARFTGEGIGDGLIAGMNAKQIAIMNTGKLIGKIAAQAAKDGALVASPSKITTYVGTMIGAGLVVGMEKSEDKVEAEGKNLAGASLSAFQDAVKDSAYLSDKIAQNLSNSMTPVITPVLNLDDIQNQSKDIATLLNGQTMTLDLSSNIDTNLIRSLQSSDVMRNSMLDYQKTSGKQIDNVLAQFAGLRSDMNNLNRAIASMRVVMDSGELVGSIASGVDKQLGRNAVYAERGI